MKGQRILVSVLLLGLLVALAGELSLARGPRGDDTPRAALGTAFTYQGRLTDGGSLANGTYDLQFKLYDDPAAGSQVGGTVTVDDKQITDGLFTVELDFGSAAFAGDARYLEVGVRPGASSGEYSVFPERQALTAAPYALSLYPGAVIRGDTSLIPTLWVHNTNSLTGYGLMAQTDADTTGAGVHGIAVSASGQVHGVFGKSLSTSGYGVHGKAPQFGVYGEATRTSDLSYGVYGQSDSTAGQGVYGHATADSGVTYGVYGQSDSTSGQGVYGRADATSGVNYGGRFVSMSSDGYGVYAQGGKDVGLGGTVGSIHATGWANSDMELHSNDLVDVHLDDDGGSTSMFRVVNGSDVIAFAVEEDGNVSWLPQTGYLALSAAAFRPRVDGYDFDNDGVSLTNVDGSSYYYYADVQLPHGATVTKVTFYWYDVSGSNNGTAWLRRNKMDGTQDFMASVSTTASGGNGSSYDDSIDYAAIDNSQYSYYAQWLLPDSNVVGYGMVIEYTYTGP